MGDIQGLGSVNAESASTASSITVMVLTRIERNQLLEAIAASALDPGECSLNDLDNMTVISHNRSTSAFNLSEEPIGNFDMEYDVNYYIDGGHHRNWESLQLNDVVSILTEWADEVKEITDAPDLWAEMQRSRELAIEVQSADAGNTSFTQDERRQIAAQLEAIKEQVKDQFDLTSQQLARIDEWKDEVAEATERSGRKDWRLLVYGTIINLAVTDAVPPEVARHLLTMFIHVVAQLFGGGPPQILA